MPIKQNPFGVGFSGDNWTNKAGRCECCTLPFSATVHAQEPVPRWCPECRGHYAVQDESVERKVERLTNHEGRLLTYLGQARDAANRLQTEVNERRAQTKSALRSREEWRAVLTEVATLHNQGVDGRKCECGVQWPCETWQVLQQDRRIAREVNTRQYRDLINETGRFEFR